MEYIFDGFQILFRGYMVLGIFFVLLTIFAIWDKSGRFKPSGIVIAIVECLSGFHLDEGSPDDQVNEDSVLLIIVGFMSVYGISVFFDSTGYVGILGLLLVFLFFSIVVNSDRLQEMFKSSSHG